MVVLITTGIIIAVILITGLIIQAVYTVEDVEVEGNIHYTNEEIEELACRINAVGADFKPAR